MKSLTFVVVALGSLGIFAGEQLMNLPPCEKGKTRFAALTDRVWPKDPGAADVCLWADDRFAACAITIDDNCKPDHEWWLKLTEELGIKVTWFVITDGVEKKSNPGFSGTWEDFQKLANAGHSLQSHTTNHKWSNNGKTPITDDEYAAMYRDSLAALNAHVTNNFACTVAYPWGEAKPEILAKYAIAARGVHGVPNQANTINYLCTGKGAESKGHVQIVAFGETEEGPKWIRGMKNLKRGLNIVLYHFVHAGRSPEEKAKNAAKAEADIRYIASLKDDRLWVCRFDDVMKYGQERDSATLSVKENTPKRVTFELTDRMKDELFDFPLTVKIRLPEGAKAVAAKQGGKTVEAKVVEHEGAAYALVKAVPDRGLTTVAFK